MVFGTRPEFGAEAVGGGEATQERGGLAGHGHGVFGRGDGEGRDVAMEHAGVR